MYFQKITGNLMYSLLSYCLCSKGNPSNFMIKDNNLRMSPTYFECQFDRKKKTVDLPVLTPFIKLFSMFSSYYDYCFLKASQLDTFCHRS